MSELLLLDQQSLRQALPYPELIAALENAFLALARGEAANPLRQLLFRPDRRGLLGVMPAYAAAPPSFVVKAVSVFPEAAAAGIESHQGAVLLFEADNGQLLAILEGSELTARRTAAASALATRTLAREDAGDLALLGAGILGWSHLLALGEVRRLRRVRIHNRTAAKAEALAARAREELGLDAAAVASAEAAVRGADLVCTLTASPTPILEGAWLSPGAHLNVVGSCTPKNRELDTAAVVRSRFFADRRESVMAEAGDFLIPRAEGAIGDEHFRGELGELLAGDVPGRRGPEEITLFKSLGIALEDLAAARLAYAVAKAHGLGQNLSWTAPYL